MSIDDELRAAESVADKAKVDEIHRRLGATHAERLAAQFRVEVSQLESEIQSAKQTIQRNEERIKFLKEVSAAILPPECPSCNGMGAFRNWIAQDESELVRCDACGGTGFKKG